MSKPHESYSSKKAQNTRVKVKPRKKTVGITLPPNLVKRAREHKLNISRISEQALLSILGYLETQNMEKAHYEGISTAVELSLQQRVAPGMGFEPMRPKGATGSQGLRIIHSAHGMSD